MAQKSGQPVIPKCPEHPTDGFNRVKYPPQGMYMADCKTCSKNLVWLCPKMDLDEFCTFAIHKTPMHMTEGSNRTWLETTLEMEAES